jgi:hypothetical protein
MARWQLVDVGKESERIKNPHKNTAYIFYTFQACQLSGYIVSHVILEEMFPADIYED